MIRQQASQGAIRPADRAQTREAGGDDGPHRPGAVSRSGLAGVRRVGKGGHRAGVEVEEVPCPALLAGAEQPLGTPDVRLVGLQR